MKKIAILLISILIFSCSKKEDIQPASVNEYQEIQVSQTQKSLIESSNYFGFNLFNELNTIVDDESNLFISPLSISCALTMTYNGAAGETKDEMKEVLGFGELTDEEINMSFKTLILSLLTVDPSTILNIANSIWYKESYEEYIEPNFISTNQNFFNAEVEALDFDLPEAVDVINNWIETETNGLIKEMLDEIPSNAVMYLINAIYFKGSWVYQFNTENTEDMPFYLPDENSINIPTMIQEGTFDYTMKEKYSIIDLPYGSTNFSMLVLLPNAGFTSNDIMTDLNQTNWDIWLNDLVETENIQLYLPKFKTGYKALLNDPLISLGIEKAFTGAADFSKISEVLDLYISRVIHQSFVEVNEEGTEAAAATIVEMGESSMPQMIYFNVNKPFVFAIKERSSNTILFIGEIVDPSQE